MNSRVTIYIHYHLTISSLFLLSMAASSSYCGSNPTVTNPSTSNVSWTIGSGYNVNYTSLEIRRVDNIWSQTATGCLSSVHVVSTSSAFYSVPNVDYDSLYIARVFWYDFSHNRYYRNNSECYFIPQRSEYLYM